MARLSFGFSFFSPVLPGRNVQPPPVWMMTVITRGFRSSRDALMGSGPDSGWVTTGLPNRFPTALFLTVCFLLYFQWKLKTVPSLLSVKFGRVFHWMILPSLCLTTLCFSSQEALKSNSSIFISLGQNVLLLMAWRSLGHLLESHHSNTPLQKCAFSLSLWRISCRLLKNTLTEPILEFFIWHCIKTNDRRLHFRFWEVHSMNRWS